MPRTFTVKCESSEGEVIMIKKGHFLKYVYDEYRTNVLIRQKMHTK